MLSYIQLVEIIKKTEYKLLKIQKYYNLNKKNKEKENLLILKSILKLSKIN